MKKLVLFWSEEKIKNEIHLDLLLFSPIFSTDITYIFIAECLEEPCDKHQRRVWIRDQLAVDNPDLCFTFCPPCFFSSILFFYPRHECR